MRTNPAYMDELAYEPGDPKSADVGDLEELVDLREACS